MAGFNFTSHALKALQAAHEEAQRLHSSSVGVQHLLLALGSRSQPGLGLPLQLGTDLSQLRSAVQRAALPTSTPTADLQYSDELKAVLNRSIDEARTSGHSRTMSEHLFLALLAQPSILDLLAEANVDAGELRERLLLSLGSADGLIS